MSSTDLTWYESVKTTHWRMEPLILNDAWIANVCKELYEEEKRTFGESAQPDQKDRECVHTDEHQTKA